MKKIFAILSLVLLTGCSWKNVSGSWDCPADKGFPCITMNEADSIARARLEINKDKESKPQEKKEIKARATPLKGIDHKVWFASYQDEQGNFHEQSIVHYME